MGAFDRYNMIVLTLVFKAIKLAEVVCGRHLDSYELSHCADFPQSFIYFGLAVHGPK